MILEATACAIRKREEPTVEVSDREYANSLTTIQKDSMIAEKRIRKLSPKECFRLMGFDDEDYEKAHSVCSDTQLYKQAGNRQPLVQVTAAALRKRGDGQVLETSNREIANSITTIQKDSLVNENMRIRKLTPKECWRLMGFDDCDFDKASQVNSDTQLYKQAGNSIVVNVLTAIFGEMLPKAPEER